MTTTDKPVRRVTYSSHRGRNIVIELHSTFATLRLKGMRFRYTLDYAAVWDLAAKLEARRVRDEKIAAKKEAKKRGN